MAMPGYHADCGDIAHGSCCGKNDTPMAFLLSDSLPCIDHLDVPAMSFGEGQDRGKRVASPSG